MNTSRFEYWDSKAITWRLAKGGGKENFNLGVVCQLNTAHTCMPNKRSVIDERFKKLFKSFKCRKGHPVYVIFPNGDAEKITEDLKSYISSKFEDLREKKPAKSPEEIYKELSEAFIKQYHADKEQLQPASPPQGGMQRRRGRKILMLA